MEMHLLHSLENPLFNNFVSQNTCLLTTPLCCLDARVISGDDGRQEYKLLTNLDRGKWQNGNYKLNNRQGGSKGMDSKQENMGKDVSMVGIAEGKVSSGGTGCGKAEFNYLI